MQKKLNRINDLLNSGDLYAGVDDELITYQHELVERLNQFNSTPDTPEGLKKREEILREALGTYGDGLYIIPPIYANWGLKNVHVGKNVIFNFNVCLVDDADIFDADLFCCKNGCDSCNGTGLICHINVKNIGAGDQAVIYNVNGITVILGTCEHVKNIVGFSVINGTADLDQHTDKFVQNCGNVFLVFQADLLPHNW